ncbi:MAG: hypothetical protein ABI543_05310 [Ignavibacteria bacterium]
MNRLKLTIILLFVFASFIKADVIQEGKKKIYYSFEVLNIDSYPDYTFIAYPVNFSNGVPDIHAVKLTPGEDLGISCKFGSPEIYAVKNTEFNSIYFDSLNSITDDVQRTSKLKSLISGNKIYIPSLKVSCSNYADRDVKYNYVQEQFSIESIKPDTMIINSKKTIYKDQNKNIIDAKDSKMRTREDLVSPSSDKSGYLLIIIPILALISIVTIILVRKMKK